MGDTKRLVLLGIGNIYLETNYLGLVTAGQDTLEVGKEYQAVSYEIRLGGSVVNFVLQAKALGASVGLVGKTGEDEQGIALRSLLEAQGVSHDLITSSPDVQTNVDTGVVFEHNGQNIQLVAGGANKSLSIDDIDTNNPFLESVSAVYMGGFFKQEALYKDYPALLSELKKKGIKLFLDHGRIPVDVSDDKKNTLTETLRHVDGYFPNEEELMSFAGGANLEEALAKALEMGPKFVAVKLGAEGCRVKSKGEDITMEGHKVAAVTTVGAGDSFNAGFITSFFQGRSLRDCAEIANAVAAIKVSQNKYAGTGEVRDFLGK